MSGRFGHPTPESRRHEQERKQQDRKKRQQAGDVLQLAADADAPCGVHRMVDNYQARYIALRATTIARTEGVGAANNGHVEAVRGFLDQNPEFTVIKTWIATDDSRTRQDHRELDRKAVVGLDTPFRAGSGDLILWPHDPDAPARQVVNCRCTLSTQIVPRASAALYGTDAAGFPTSELNLDTENA